MSARTRFSLLFVSSLMVLSACGAGKPTDGTQSGDLLATNDAPMNLVEEETKLNPEQQHAEARKQVNPSAHDSSKYTSKGDKTAQDQPVHFRVLKLERQMSGLREDFGKLLKPLSKIPTGDNELKDTVTSIEMQQQKAAAEHLSMYDEPAMPMPGHATDAEEVQSAALKSDEMAPQPVKEEVRAKGEPLDVAPPPPPVKPQAKSQSETHARVDSAEKTEAVEIIEAPDPAHDEKKLPIEEPTQADAPRVADVSGVRVGEHPGKVRIVLDVTGPVKFTTDVDNKEQVLLVGLPETGWSTDAAKVLKNKLVKGYKVQETQGGTVLAIKLAGPSKVLMATAMPPNATYGHRIALDIGAL